MCEYITKLGLGPYEMWYIKNQSTYKTNEILFVGTNGNVLPEPKSSYNIRIISYHLLLQVGGWVYVDKIYKIVYKFRC